MQMDDMPSTLVVPLLIPVECVNLHQLLDVNHHAAQGLRQRPCWNHREGGPGKSGADVGGCPGVDGSLLSLLPLATLWPICCPGQGALASPLPILCI